MWLQFIKRRPYLLYKFSVFYKDRFFGGAWYGHLIRISLNGRKESILLSLIEILALVKLLPQKIMGSKDYDII